MKGSNLAVGELTLRLLSCYLYHMRDIGNLESYWENGKTEMDNCS